MSPEQSRGEECLQPRDSEEPLVCGKGHEAGGGGRVLVVLGAECKYSLNSLAVLSPLCALMWCGSSPALSTCARTSTVMTCCSWGLSVVT